MHVFMNRFAKAMAIIGGAFLAVLIVLICVSVVGRVLNGVFHGPVAEILPEFSKWALAMGVGPINGDFELVESGIAFAIFAFIPLCQITSAHASVDVFSTMFPAKLNGFLGMIIEIVFAIVLVVIAWQVYEATLAKHRYGETTFLLEMPVWWAYAASFLGAVAAAIVGIYMAVIRTMEFFTGRVIIGDQAEVMH